MWMSAAPRVHGTHAYGRQVYGTYGNHNPCILGRNCALYTHVVGAAAQALYVLLNLTMDLSTAQVPFYNVTALVLDWYIYMPHLVHPVLAPQPVGTHAA